MPTIAAIHRYPIKSLSVEELKSAVLAAGRPLPGDRRFALRHAESAFNPAQPTWHKKSEFAVLVHDETLAKLHTSFDDATGVLHIALNGDTQFVGNVLTEPGRRGAESVINAVVKDRRGPLQLVDAGVIALADVEPPYLSFINLASVRELGERAGAVLDPVRFRGNVLVDGLPPWAEFEWPGQTLAIGSARIKLVRRIGRCMATAVNPVTAARDVNTLKALTDHYGHTDFGVYAEVGVGGTIKPGDKIQLS
ncbi:MAG: MOSC domain-containing protein [Rhodospirillaceae bacterium]|nr:MOSC domain-containing protein [Rhodospirillaceae bacterium]